MASLFAPPLPLQPAQIVHLKARLMLGSRSLCAGGKLTNERAKRIRSSMVDLGGMSLCLPRYSFVRV